MHCTAQIDWIVIYIYIYIYIYKDDLALGVDKLALTQGTIFQSYKGWYTIKIKQTKVNQFILT